MKRFLTPFAFLLVFLAGCDSFSLNEADPESYMYIYENYSNFGINNGWHLFPGDITMTCLIEDK